MSGPSFDRCTLKVPPMAFKDNTSNLGAPASPADLFKTLSRRALPDVMPHQRDMLLAYAKDMVDEADVALQLPTGSGKTLVGLLIAEWRRLSLRNRVVYLCPTRQLVNQTVEQARDLYGIDAEGFTGSVRDFPAERKATFTTGDKVAVATYSALFNSKPFFSNPDVIILDDAHAAENYVAKMWSLWIPLGEEAYAPLHAAVSGILRPSLTTESHARLTGDWRDMSDTTWVDKLPSPVLAELAPKLVAAIDANSDATDHVIYTWPRLREHLGACHVYLASQGILIRPLVPPTWTHPPFANARQRIYMSATLGAGGDLERLTGVARIKRVPAPAGFESTGVGRRFFIFPGLSLETGESDRLRLDLQGAAGRSVVLTPSEVAAAGIREQVVRAGGFRLFDARAIEESKEDFIRCGKAVAVMANRFDGVDFPNDQCRLLCLDGLPKAGNFQERFLMTKMSASVLFNERMQTRVLQAAGRCTRALQDRSAVVVTGHELVEYLADDRNWTHFHPELQAELAFGVEQSKGTGTADLLDNFNSFLANDHAWDRANGSIIREAARLRQTAYPAMDVLQAVVGHEIGYQSALWAGDPETALVEARAVLAKLTAPELRGYRALWHYLAGSAAWSASSRPDDGHRRLAREQYGAALKAAPAVAWLARLARAGLATEAAEAEVSDVEVVGQVDRLEALLLRMGTTNDRKFEAKAKRILTNLGRASTFEEGHRELGELLGFTVGNDESDAAPDPWWLGDEKGIVFEDHADGSESTVLGANKARQAASHPDWIRDNVPEAKATEVTAVLVTPCLTAGSGAKPTLRKVLYWPLDDFRAWARSAVDVVRELKAHLPPHGDLFWKDRARDSLQAGGCTIPSILGRLAPASEAMTFNDQ